MDSDVVESDCGLSTRVGYTLTKMIGKFARKVLTNGPSSRVGEKRLFYGLCGFQRRVQPAFDSNSGIRGAANRMAGLLHRASAPTKAAEPPEIAVGIEFGAVLNRQSPGMNVGGEVSPGTQRHNQITHRS